MKFIVFFALLAIICAAFANPVPKRSGGLLGGLGIGADQLGNGVGGGLDGLGRGVGHGARHLGNGVGKGLGGFRRRI